MVEFPLLKSDPATGDAGFAAPERLPRSLGARPLAPLHLPVLLTFAQFSWSRCAICLAGRAGST